MVKQRAAEEEDKLKDQVSPPTTRRTPGLTLCSKVALKSDTSVCLWLKVHRQAEVFRLD